MHYIPFNSRKTYHKSPFGAVCAGSKVVFRLILPHSFGAEKLWLAIRKDGSHDYDFRAFEAEDFQGDSERWWSLSYIAGEPGLYYYDFAYDTAHSRVHIYNCGKGLGQINCKPGQWQLTVYDPDFKTPEKFKGGIIYQIFPDRFCASGSPKSDLPIDRIINKDWGGLPQWQPDEFGKIEKYDFFGGDLKGIEEKLPYLKDLGVSCIYLNPIFTAHTNHRYDTANYMEIDPMLGDEDDFKSLCFASEKLGISIILDGVFSHTGADSIYFNKFGRYKGAGAYNSKASPYYPWFKFNTWPNDYASWWGVDILPELDEENPDFIEYISGEDGVAQKWLKAGASGWRLDVADELPHVFLDEFRKSVKSVKEDAYILGEVWEDASDKISHGGRRRYLLGDQLDSVMNYPFSDALLRFISGGSGADFAEAVMGILENYPKPAIDTLMNHLGTHDTVRILSLLGGATDAGKDCRAYTALSPEQITRAKKLLKTAITVLYCLPGIPSIYYGDEAGLEGGCDPYNRACYPWGKEDCELIDFYKTLGKLRRANSCFISGDFETIYEGNRALAFLRSSADSSVLCFANFGAEKLSFHLPEKLRKASPILGQAVIDGNKVSIEGESACLLEL